MLANHAVLTFPSMRGPADVHQAHSPEALHALKRRTSVVFDVKMMGDHVYVVVDDEVRTCKCLGDMCSMFNGSALANPNFRSIAKSNYDEGPSLYDTFSRQSYCRFFNSHCLYVHLS